MSLKIAVDVDGTLADIHTPFIEELNKNHEANTRLDDITDYDFATAFDHIDLATEEIVKVLQEIWHSETEIKPIDENAASIISKLSENNQIDIVTANEAHEPIRIWLEKNSIPHENFIHSTFDKHNLDYDIFVDDNPRLAKREPEKTILFERPWNENNEHPHRIESFDELPQMIERLMKN